MAEINTLFFNLLYDSPENVIQGLFSFLGVILLGIILYLLLFHYDNENAFWKNGFGWGNFWIFSSYLYASFSLILFLVLDLIIGYSWDYSNSEILLFRFILLIQSILLFASAHSLRLRLKWAINVIYLILLLNCISSFIFLFIDSSLLERIKDMVAIAVAYCWYIYFSNRKEILNQPIIIEEKTASIKEPKKPQKPKVRSEWDNL